MGKKVEKPFNEGTMSNAAFFGMIRAALRRQTRFWKPKLACLKAVSRPYKGPNKRQKWEYQCSNCKDFFIQKEVEVNHIIPAGSLNNYEDLPGFVERLFCKKEDLEVMCKKCHLKVTKNQKESKNDKK